MKESRWTRIGAFAAVALGTGAGCKQDARLADAKVKPAIVTDVVDSGLSLDKNASPAMVAFALLRAIKDDVEARSDLKAREAAFDRQYRLAAPSAIQRQHAHFIGAQHADKDESVYKTVQTWAPTLAYYVDNFNFTWDEAKKSLKTTTVPATDKSNAGRGEEAHVRLQVRDPDDEPNASAVVRVRLVQEEGRWRVWWVGFDHVRRLRSEKLAAATQPAG